MPKFETPLTSVRLLGREHVKTRAIGGIYPPTRESINELELENTHICIVYIYNIRFLGS